MTESPSTKVNKSSQNLIPESARKLARRHLETVDTPALVAYEAAKFLIGHDIDLWETESVAHELLETHKLSLHDITLNKIWCIMAVHQNKEVLTNAHVLQKIVLALNNELPNPQIDEKVEVEQLAWALLVLAYEMKTESVYFDYEPVKYITLVVHDEGFIVAPSALKFVQPGLDMLNKNPELAKEIKASLDGKSVSMSTAAKAQLAKRQRVDDYAHIMYDDMIAGLKHYRRV
jgi:hypothetical protein